MSGLDHRRFDHHWAHRAILTSDLPSSARHVLHALVVHASADGLAWPSQLTLQEETGLSERTVQRVLRRLREGRVLEPRGRPHRSITYLLEPANLTRRAGVTPSSPALEPATLADEGSRDPATMAGYTRHLDDRPTSSPRHHGGVNPPNGPPEARDPATMAGYTRHPGPSDPPLPRHHGGSEGVYPAMVTPVPRHHGGQTVHEQSIREEEGPLTGGRTRHPEPAIRTDRGPEQAPTTSYPTPSMAEPPTPPSSPTRHPALGDFGAVAAWWAKGIAEGQGHPCSTPGRPDDLRELAAVVRVHAVDDGHPLEGPLLYAWVRESGRQYAKTTHPAFWGRTVRRWATWEDSGRPAEPVKAAGTVRRGNILQPLHCDDDLEEFPWGKAPSAEGAST